MSERSGEHFESPDSTSPEDEGLDLELEPESSKTEDSRIGGEDKGQEKDRAQASLDKEYKKASHKEFKLDHPELDTSSEIPDLGKDFWGAPIATLKGLWHRTLAPSAWDKRTRGEKGAGLGDSWAKKYDAFKKAREGTIEKRGWAEEPVGAKWYSMPVGIANLTTPIRGLWYSITKPACIINNDLSPNEFTHEDTEEANIYNLDRNSYRSFLHPIQTIRNEIDYYKKLAEHVEWKKTRDRNPTIKSTLEKMGKKAAQEYNKSHKDAVEKAEKKLEYGLSIETIRSLRWELQKLKTADRHTEKRYILFMDKQNTGWEISSERLRTFLQNNPKEKDVVIDHCTENFMSNTTYQYRTMPENLEQLESRVREIMSEIVNIELSKLSEPTPEDTKSETPEETQKERPEIITNAADAAIQVMNAVTPKEFLQARDDFRRSINEKLTGITQEERSMLANIDLINQATKRIQTFMDAPRGEKYKALGIEDRATKSKAKAETKEESTTESEPKSLLLTWERREEDYILHLEGIPEEQQSKNVSINIKVYISCIVDKLAVDGTDTSDSIKEKGITIDVIYTLEFDDNNLTNENKAMLRTEIERFVDEAVKEEGERRKAEEGKKTKEEKIDSLLDESAGPIEVGEDTGDIGEDTGVIGDRPEDKDQEDWIPDGK